jgi:hypothetical protein
MSSSPLLYNVEKDIPPISDCKPEDYYSSSDIK